MDYKESCTTTCAPADPDVATGNGYVFEVTNTAYRIWTTNGTLLLNSSLSSLFGTHADTLNAPQVRYDPTTLRWIVTVEDVSMKQIFYAGSLSSDPTGSWNVHSLDPGGGETPAQPILAVNEFNIVVTTNIYLGNVFQGAQVWAVNKTQLLADAAPPTWNDAPVSTNQSLVPADPVGSSAVMYLLSDYGGTHLDLFTLTGSPPAVPVLSAPVAFPSVTAAPPSASQEGTPNLINVEDARVQSAVWNAGELWAAADVACMPSGDVALRSCLHLWELSTKTDAELQDFNWSTGPGTFDFFPAVSITTGDDIAVVFEQSSAEIYPGVYATAQSTSDPAGSLEPALTLEVGKGPDNHTGVCALGVCSFGNYSGAAATPYASSGFFVVGEYIGSDWATDAWHTWIEALTVRSTYRVSFSESDLPPGTSWSVVVNGATNSSTSSLIGFNELNGSYSFTVTSPISGGAGVRFVANLTAGSFTIAGSGFNQAITYVSEFELNTSVNPVGSGTVYPSTGWFNDSATVNLSALAGAGHGFVNWTGTGPGSYNGTSDPAAIVMGGPISEQAQFFTKVTFPVTFGESGLPAGTPWSVSLNGVPESLTSSPISFNEPNGSYSFIIASPIAGGPGTRLLANLTSGDFSISGAGFSESVSFATQFELTTTVTPEGAGTVSPSGGWFNESSVVTLSSLAASGHGFSSWVGTGSGSYSGPADPAVITMDEPTSEQAQFSTSVTFRMTFTVSGLPAGTGWSVALNGVSNSSTGSAITFNEPNGSYSFSTAALISGSPGTRFSTSSASGSFDIAGAGITEPLSYVTQFELTTSATPSTAGTVAPLANWYDSGSVVELSALPGAGYQFAYWQGSGAGSYAGPDNPVNVIVQGPISEVASFSGKTASGTSSSSGTVPLWAFVSLLGLSIVAILLLLGIAMRRRRAPPRPPPRPVEPAVAPAPVAAPAPSAQPTGSEEWREDTT